MSKITLNSVADLTQSSTAQTTINTNSSTVQTAFDNTLSRDGTSPNQMGANLDMNSNQILNLGAPITGNSPVRLTDLNLIVNGQPLNIITTSTGAISVLTFGAKADGITDDTQAIKNAIAGTPSGGTLIFPPTSCLVSGAGSEIFLITKPIYIVGSGMQAGGIKVASTVPNTTDIFHFVPALGGMRGTSIRDLAITAQSGTPGRHIIHVDTTSANNIFAAEFEIRRVSTYDTAHGNTVYFNNGAAGLGVFNSSISDSLLLGPVNLTWVGDSIRINGNIISTYAANSGNPITISQLGGAGNIVIENNNVTGGGGTVVSASTGIIITHNEFEQITSTTEANTAIIDLTGSSTQNVRPLVVGNQVQANAGTGCSCLVRVANCNGTVIDQNYFGAGNSFPAVINTAAATGTVLGPNNTYVGTSANISDSGTGTVYSILPASPNKVNVLSNGKVGIGTETNPQHLLSVSSNVTTGLAAGSIEGLYVATADGVPVAATIDSYGVVSGGPNIVGRFARNTAASQQAVQSGDQLAFYQGLGHDGSAFNINEAAGFRVEATETWTTAHYGSRLTFYCTPTSTTARAEAARINGNGSLSVGVTTDPGAGCIISATNATAIPVTLTGTSGTVTAAQSSIIFNASGAFTVTLPAAASFPGRWLYLKNIAAQTVTSASSNVVPITTATAGTAILAGTAGKYASLQSDGANWIIMNAN